jgi:hypothetical protein
MLGNNGERGDAPTGERALKITHLPDVKQGENGCYE